eukprot:TRINITY_DN4759_c0_g1_i1.p1 TRINITY_DN4759_c0_g1~~TRINITY_DN4759_c0_g1_i1.p1  ORF type:complete len:275 (+),score=64.92 TRINITY_DN4759_c0_g1_i1:133-957(+)
MDLSIEEITNRLEDFNQQLQSVRQDLEEHPNNKELEQLKAGLLEVIKGTRDLLVLKQEAELLKKAEIQAADEALNKVDIQEIAASRGLAVGTKCEAIYSVDGVWYDAKIDRITDEGFVVTFTGYGNTEVVPPNFIKLKEEKQFKKRKREDFSTASAAVLQNIPKSLQILPTDSEKVRKVKKRRVKAIKAKGKLQKVEAERNERKKNWQSFVSGFGTKKKTGFYTGTVRKQSIFRSPDSVEGKVGVTGSGQGMTENKKVEYQPKALKTKLPSLKP